MESEKKDNGEGRVNLKALEFLMTYKEIILIVLGIIIVFYTILHCTSIIMNTTTVGQAFSGFISTITSFFGNDYEVETLGLETDSDGNPQLTYDDLYEEYEIKVREIIESAYDEIEIYETKETEDEMESIYNALEDALSDNISSLTTTGRENGVYSGEAYTYTITRILDIPDFEDLEIEIEFNGEDVVNEVTSMAIAAKGATSYSVFDTDEGAYGQAELTALNVLSNAVKLENFFITTHTQYFTLSSSSASEDILGGYTASSILTSILSLNKEYETESYLYESYEVPIYVLELVDGIEKEWVDTGETRTVEKYETRITSATYTYSISSDNISLGDTITAEADGNLLTKVIYDEDGISPSITDGEYTVDYYYADLSGEEITAEQASELASTKYTVVYYTTGETYIEETTGSWASDLFNKIKNALSSIIFGYEETPNRYEMSIEDYENYQSILSSTTGSLSGSLSEETVNEIIQQWTDNGVDGDIIKVLTVGLNAVGAFSYTSPCNYTAKTTSGGLDCSGFVRWMFMYAANSESIATVSASEASNMPISTHYYETSGVSVNKVSGSKQVGDLVIKYGSSSNHVKVYLGTLTVEGTTAEYYLECYSDGGTSLNSWNASDYTNVYRYINW